jgi:hypothetical protein
MSNQGTMENTWPWPALDTCLKQVELPAGYRLQLAASSDIPNLCQQLALWYPDIHSGYESCHLQEDFYFENAYLLDKQKHAKTLLPLLFMHGSELIGVISIEKHVLAYNVTSRMGALAPGHRGSGLGSSGPVILETVGRAMNAGLLYYMVTLKIPHQQAAAEKSGFQLAGIIPAFDRDTVAPGIVKRVPEAIYCKVLSPVSELLELADLRLTPKTQKLWNLLFEKNIDTGATQ